MVRSITVLVDWSHVPLYISMASFRATNTSLNTESYVGQLPENMLTFMDPVCTQKCIIQLGIVTKLAIIVLRAF